MTAANELILLTRMEAARRQTRVHLDLVERQIEGRAERSTVTARVKGRPFGRDGAAWTPGDERLFRETLERLAFARRSEIEALSRKLARQDWAIAALRGRLRIETILRGLTSARSPPSRTGGHYAALYDRDHLSPSRLSALHL